MVSYQKKSQKKIKKAPKDAYISLKHINKIYDNKVQAVFDFNLDIAKHEFIVLVGPSGCGKSTTLRMIAGLESITAGDLFIDNTYANELHPKDRDIAMVFQSYALYPHMSVAGNMAFGLKIRKVPMLKVDENGKPILGINKKAIKVLETQLHDLKQYAKDPEEGENLEELEKDIKGLEEKINYLKVTPVEIYENKHLPKEEIRKRVEDAARILQIEEYLNRKPKALSGGQCQRVALGRAIVKNAKVFLMDEPLSNLDAKLRVAMRSEIIRLHNTLNATTIYVTHDQTEAMTMATRIVVMNKGYIQQIGSPAMNMMNATFNKGKLMFEKGTVINLPKDFGIALNKFYKDELADLQVELTNLDKEFIERNEYLTKISNVEKEIESTKDAKLENELIKLKEELKACEESNSRREYLINTIAEMKNIDVKKDVPVIFGIRPEDIYQSNRVLTDGDISQEFNLIVSVAELLGHEYYVHTNFESGEIVSKIHAKTLLHSGDEIKLVFDISKIHLFDRITKKLIK